MDGTIIIADDDKNLRMVLTQSLTRAGAKVRATATLSTLWRWLEEGEGDVVLCDVNLADGDAIELLPKMKKLRPNLPIIMMSAQNTVVTALRSAEAGAYDYLAKPFDLREMTALLDRAKGESGEKASGKTIDASQALPMIGRSPIMQELYKQISRIMSSDLPLLISGEIGTGKSHAANVIHKEGPRKNEPILRYDGYSNDPNKIENAFRDAAAGTIIFENIDEILPSEQREILAILERQKYPCRIIAISRDGIAGAMKEGNFREDLYHRLNGLRLEMPRLTDRLEDIEELAQHFLLASKGVGKHIGQDAISYLRSLLWPGNIAELELLIRAASALSAGDEITVGELKKQINSHQNLSSGNGHYDNLGDAVETYTRRFLKLHGSALPPDGLYMAMIDEVDRPIIEVVLEYTGGNQIKAAEILGINRNTLRKKISKLDISVTKSKKLM